MNKGVGGPPEVISNYSKRKCGVTMCLGRHADIMSALRAYRPAPRRLRKVVIDSFIDKLKTDD